MIEVCNEEISISYNNKTSTYKNYLLSNFLNKFVQKNFGADDNFGMTVIYGIFNDDAEIAINENTSFEVPDFENLDEIVPLNAYKYYSTYIKFLKLDIKYNYLLFYFFEISSNNISI